MPSEPMGSASLHSCLESILPAGWLAPHTRFTLQALCGSLRHPRGVTLHENEEHRRANGSGSRVTCEIQC